MKNSKKILIGLICICLFSIVQAQINALIPAVQSKVNADLPINNTTSGKFAFALNTFPVGSQVTSCNLQLRLKTQPSDKLVLDLTLGSKSTYPNSLSNYKPRVSLVKLNLKNKAESIVNVEIKPEFIRSNLNDTLFLELSLSSSNTANVAFYNSVDIPGKRPRLIVEYNAQQMAQAWPQAHNNQMRDRMSFLELRGPNAKSYQVFKIIGLNNILTEVLMYGGNIYVVNYAPNAKIGLYEIAPLSGTFTVVAETLPVPVVPPAIDPFGRFYLTHANGITVIDLNRKEATKDFPDRSMESGRNSPAIGRDGSVYMTSNSFISAYSAFPQHIPLWYFSLPGNCSPIALNQEGTMAYFVSYKGSSVRARTDSLIALDAVNGQRLYAASVVMEPLLTNVGPVMPLVTANGTVYLANDLLKAKQMYVFSDKLEPLNTIPQVADGYISLPAAAFEATQKANDVYFLNGGDLFRADGKNSPAKMTLQAGQTRIDPSKTIRSIVSDHNNNVFCTTSGNAPMVYSFVNTGRNTFNRIETKSGLGGSLEFQGPLISGNDGSLYTQTSNQVYAVMEIPDGPYAYTAKDGQLNNRSFRGTTMTVADNATTNVKQSWVGYLELLIGQNVEIQSGANVYMRSSQKMSFGPGFKVEKGATLRCVMGPGTK